MRYRIADQQKAGKHGRDESIKLFSIQPHPTYLYQMWKSGDFLFSTFVMLFHATRCVIGHEVLKNEWYIVIKAYKFTVFEILRDFFVLSYIACPCYPYI